MKAAKKSPPPATEQKTAWIDYGQWKRDRPHTAVGRIVVRERLINHRVAGVPMEPRGVLAIPDPVSVT